MNKRKVLYILGGRSVCGASAGRKIHSILACWRAMGCEARAIFGGDLAGGVGEISKGPDFGHASFHRKWYRRTGLLNPLVHTMSERRDMAHDVVLHRAVRAAVEEFRPDLIWERSYRLHRAGLDVARESGVPCVLEWKDHLVDYGLSLYRGRALAMERAKNREADRIVVESGVLREMLAEEGVDRSKIVVAHNAADPSAFRVDAAARAAFRARHGIGEGEVLAGYLGSYAFYHDAARLVLAADLLRQRGDLPIRVLMVGQGKEYPEARGLAEARGLLGGRVLMLPAVAQDEVPAVLSAMDIAVLPGSTDIICPVKVQEYMACELPAVVPDYACNREVIDAGETGVLFEPRSERALADALAGLAADGGLRRRMGRAARQAVAERFTWERTWGAALEKVLADLAR